MANKKNPQSRKFILKINDPYDIITDFYYSDEKEEDHGDVIDIDVGRETRTEETANSLSNEKSKRAIYFADPHKSQIKYWVCMIDLCQNGALPLKITKPCWWCRNTFGTMPLGLPINYCSDIKDNENNSPNVIVMRERVLEHFKRANLPTTDGTDFFETDGIFCSFPCMKAYVVDEMKKGSRTKFRNSLTLITLLYQKLFGRTIHIPTAGSWKLLTEYGGHLPIEKFRQTFGLLAFVDNPNIRRPMMYSCAKYIEERKI